MKNDVVDHRTSTADAGACQAGSVCETAAEGGRNTNI